MKINTKMTEAAYAISVDVYKNKIKKEQALEQLENAYGMNRGSASAYIVNLKKMMDGAKYTRTNNAEATEYFLTNILKDFGSFKLRNALKAANEHVDYYESLGRGNLNGIRAIISKHEKILKWQTETIYPDDLKEAEALFEGVRKSVIVNSYERNQTARQKCIEHYGTSCAVCSFDFEIKYGNIGTGFIHVHHLTQLSTIGQGYEVDPVKDLRPVCPNCHGMLHRTNPPYSIKQLQDLLR